MQIIEQNHILESLIQKCDTNVKGYEEYMRANFERIYADANYLRNFIPPCAKILDVGGIPPLFVHLLRSYDFYNLSVVDPSPETFSTYFRESCIESIKGNLLIDSLSKYNNTFDCVCLNEVVEHLSGNLITAIENASGCLKSGGIFMVTTPNLRSFSGLFSLMIYKSGLAAKPHDNVRAQYDRASAQYGFYGHLREYTSHEIICLFRSCGFDFVHRKLQPDYRNTAGAMRFAQMLEKMFPKWALFGKYIFRKREPL